MLLFFYLVLIVSVSFAAPPNIIIFLADDLGYGDLKSYGHPTQEWSPIDDLAREGVRFTSMYSASSLCSPSRAALLTGRLPVRIGAYGDFMNFYHTSPTGLPKKEITLPEILQEVGYTTGFVGKWHLGINGYISMDGTHLPHHHGFDWVGTSLPYSNVWECDESQIRCAGDETYTEAWSMTGVYRKHMEAPDPKNCFLYNNDTIIQQPFHHDNLTASFVSDAKKFIRQIEDNTPFFLFMSFAHTHVSMFTGVNFTSSSKRGIYGSNLREMAWAVGEIMSAVRTAGIDDNTLTYFTSDNGAHIELCNEGGDNGILKGGKANYYEGGIRVPGIVTWPRKIKPGSEITNIVSQMDIYPTLAKLAGGEIPSDRIIDGKDISKLFLDTPVSQGFRKNNERSLFFYCNDILFAVRYGDYKIHFKSMPVKSKEEIGGSCGEGGVPIDYGFVCLFCPSDCVLEHDPPMIFNVEADPGEIYNLDPVLNQKLLTKVNKIVKRHKASMKKGDPLFSTYWKGSKPCCDSSKESCSCNYP